MQTCHNRVTYFKCNTYNFTNQHDTKLAHKHIKGPFCATHSASCNIQREPSSSVEDILSTETSAY